MKDVETIEKIKKQYMDYYAVKSIGVVTVSDGTLRSLLLVCDSTKHMEERIELYDDEENPDKNTWINVEGEGYGWIWLNKPQEQWHEVLRESLLDYIREKITSTTEVEENVIVVITDDKTIYHFVERKSLMRDTVYTFSDKEIDY